ncbi:mannosyltransferase [Thauera phenylacetica B4P]|uniref:Mannosyltransferase n=1 Tax=Thauera phenylacetica B4P TaxID=1234382 RepID=N6Z3U8_9RHOO|nr:glycosyltransferase family 1 protein [Thauera phenylacetica]ENO98575.1 mannosyltransferase [Thauera phenylacetica B4P]
MLVFDGIIFSLQRSGGISVLFLELFQRLHKDLFQVINFNRELDYGIYRKPRILERFRDFKLESPCALFHSTYYRLPEAFKGPVVTTVHDYTYERYFGPVRKFVHSWQKNRAIFGSEKIICVSESTRADLLYYTGEKYESRCVVIPNGVSTEYHRLASFTPTSQVLFVGARAGYKNFKALVLALSTLPDLRLAVVGGGAFTSKERGFLEAHLSNRYAHLGYLSNRELNVEYNRSFCLVYPSLYEGFGIPILEAMRAGCPVIAVRSSSIPEVAGDAAYLMERGDPCEIRAALDFLNSSPNRAEFIRKGLERSAQFSWDRTFDRTLAVYEQLLGHQLMERE